MTTPGTEAGFDLDKLEALARANQCETMSIDLTVAPDIILELIALARQAAPDTTAQPVQAGEAVDERIMGIAHRWAQAAYAKALNKPGEDIDSIKHELRASLAPASTQQSAAKLAKVETFTIPHVSSRGNVFVLLSDLADGPVSAEQGAAEGCGCQQGQCCPVCDPDVYQQSAAKAPAAQAEPIAPEFLEAAALCIENRDAGLPGDRRDIVAKLRELAHRIRANPAAPSAGAATTSNDARALVLLKAAHDLLKKQRDAGYVLNLLAETVFYDDADCDGGCLMEDIGYVLDDPMSAHQAKKTEGT